QQLAEFDEQGFLFLPQCFSEEEVAVLRRDAEAIFRSGRQEIWREKTGAPRTAFAAHTYNEGFRLLGAHPRLIEPVEQLFGEKLYMHQFKVNAKAAFEGDVWQWHQDYGTWARDDGMPEPRAMNIAVFLDEVMPINGALMLIPRSHRQGVLAAGHDTSTTSYPLWTLDKETVTRLAARIEAGKPVRVGLIGAGKFGSMFLAQVPSIQGIEVVRICDRDLDRAKAACGTVGWDAGRIARTQFSAPGRDACTDERVDVV